MSAKVRATCPGCQTVLRIPAEWADRAVKCKTCGTVVQGKGSGPTSSPAVKPVSPGTAPAPAVKAPVATPAPVAATPAVPPAPPPTPAPVIPAPMAAAPVSSPLPTTTDQSAPAYTGVEMPPGYGQAPAYQYPAQPGYPYGAMPQGYPPPGYGMPPQPYGAPPQPYGAPPPGYGYPAAAPPGYAPPGYPPPGYGYPPPQMPVENPFGAVPVSPRAPEPEAYPAAGESSRPRYRRRSPYARYIWLGVALVMTGGLVAAGMVGMPHIKEFFAKGGKGGNTDTAANGATTGETKGPAVKPNVSAAYPRRMLVMNVSKYLYCNPLAAGKGSRGADQVTEVAKRLAFDWRVPQDPSNNQLFILSDSAPQGSRAMLKPIIQDTLNQFCETSRAQDRIMVYFGGHAIEKEGKAYLVPVDGDLMDPASLIPLDDFWAKLKECKAQQKVVVFDVCRLNEDGDQIRPGSEPMSDMLEKKLLEAPPGIQAITSCSSGQTAAEFRRTPVEPGTQDVAGSLFLSAMKHVADKGKAKITPSPDAPLPVGPWMEATRARMTEVTRLLGRTDQTPKLSGYEGQAVAMNTEEPVAKRFDLPSPPKGMPLADLAKITKPLDLPAIKSNRSSEDEPVESLLPFPEEVMKPYKPDTLDPEEIKKDEKYPIRKATLAALDAIREQWKATQSSDGMSSGLRDTFTGDTNDNVKKLVVAEQEAPARIILELEERAKELEGLMPEMEKEPSKFWQASFLYALAQTKARLAFMHEYDLALGNIRTDSLPMRDEKKGQTGLQMVSIEKMKSKKDIRDIAESAKELFAKVAEEHKGTPWAVLAKRAKVVSLGLEWRAYSPGGMFKDE